MLNLLSSLPYPITTPLLSEGSNRNMVEAVESFNELANATTELTATLLVLTCVLLYLSLLFLTLLLILQVWRPGPRW